MSRVTHGIPDAVGGAMLGRRASLASGPSFPEVTRFDVHPCLQIQRGSIYTTSMELGPQNHNKDGLLGPNSRIVVHMDPLARSAAGCQHDMKGS